MMSRILRALAIAIALGGAIDPAVTSNRRTKPEVAIIATDSSRAALADEVARALDDELTVVRGPFAGAAATVLVGDRLPETTGDLPSPAFAVIPAAEGPTVVIQEVRVPPRSSIDARTIVTTVARVSGARGRSLEVELRAPGGVVDRLTRQITDDDARLELDLVFVPTTPGPAPLRITGRVVGTTDEASVDVVTDVRDARPGVLFFDPRPSWMSTFVRRAIERDPRFVVSSRVVTSRNVSTDAGRPPSSLGDADAVDPFDVIVVGAPEALTAGEVSGLEAYLRRRGGSVILLLDQRATGAYTRLVPVGEWMRAGDGSGLAITRSIADSAGLRASEIAWPRALPPAAEPLATSGQRPVIWRSAVGAGTVIVSGALDAWRFRDPSRSAFESFWRTLVAESAVGPPAIGVAIDDGVLPPGARADVIATIRDVALADPGADRPVRTNLSAAIETPAGPIPFALWPEGAMGRFRGSLRAPNAPGAYRVVVSADGLRGDASLVVAETVARATPDESDLVAAWSTSRGGVALPATRLAELAPLVRHSLPPTVRLETWYPMRSPWWIVPFTLLLGAEWFRRRRSGLP